MAAPVRGILGRAVQGLKRAGCWVSRCGRADKMKRPRQNRGLFQIGPILYGQETDFVFIGQFYNVFQIQHECFAGLKGYNMEPRLVGAF